MAFVRRVMGFVSKETDFLVSIHEGFISFGVETRDAMKGLLRKLTTSRGCAKRKKIESITYEMA